MAITTKTEVRNGILQLINDWMGLGGKLEIRNGSPAGVNNAAGGTKLVEFTTNSTSAFATISAGVATLNPVADAGQLVNASANGTATHARFVSNAGVAVYECAVGTSGSDVNINILTQVANTPVQFLGGTITAPN